MACGRGASKARAAHDDAGPTASRIAVVLDDNPSVVMAAQERGAIAATELPIVMHLLAQAVTVAGIDRQARRLLMLHGGAVADPSTDRAVAVVAASGAGKTTFVRKTGHGLVYLTDETVALEDDCSIVPYPKPLSIHAEGVNLKEQLTPDEAGLTPPSATYSLAALWFLDRREEPTDPHLEPLEMLDAITTIAPHISYLSSLPSPLHRLAGAIDAAGGMSRVVYHEAADLRPLVDQAIGASR